MKNLINRVTRLCGLRVCDPHAQDPVQLRLQDLEKRLEALERQHSQSPGMTRYGPPSQLERRLRFYLHSLAARSLEGCRI